MTKKKEQQPRGRPNKKSKEIFRDESDAKKPEIGKPEAKPKPEYEGVKVSEERLDLSEKKAEAKEGAEKTTCLSCKNELDGEKKPRFCPNCGIELNWGG